MDEVTARECEVTGTSSLSVSLWSPVVDEVTAGECEVTSTSSLCVSGVRWWTRSQRVSVK